METKSNKNMLRTYFKTMNASLNRILSRKSVKYGLPFLILVVGGSFGLREWTQIRYQFSRNKGISREEAEKMGLVKTREVTLEKVYDEIQEIDIDNWTNIRGPRPWENNATSNTEKAKATH